MQINLVIFCLAMIVEFEVTAKVNLYTTDSLTGQKWRMTISRLYRIQVDLRAWRDL